MQENSVHGSILINANASRVWEALTNPDQIVLYTGSKATTDWAVNSSVSWAGELFGTTYENKGIILENSPHSVLKFTYWSGMGGDMDLPDNYSVVTYNINELEAGSVELAYSRVKIPTEMETLVFKDNIKSMLEEIKRIAEVQS